MCKAFSLGILIILFKDSTNKLILLLVIIILKVKKHYDGVVEKLRISDYL